MFTVCTTLPRVYIELLVTTYRNLEIACNEKKIIFLKVSTLGAPLVRDVCGLILVSNHLP